MTNLAWMEFASSYLTASLIIACWLMIGKIGLLAMKELTDRWSSDVGIRISSDGMYWIGPIMIFISLIIYWEIRIRHIVNWFKYRKEIVKSKPTGWDS